MIITTIIAASTFVIGGLVGYKIRGRQWNKVLSQTKIRRNLKYTGYLSGKFDARAPIDSDYNDIVFNTRKDAEDTLTSLFELLHNYGVATLSDLKDLIGVTSMLIDNKWGWTDLGKAVIKNKSIGYTIVLPKPRLLD